MATGERSTRQKRALAAALAGVGGFRSAQELHADLRARGERVGLTTVYAQLRQLVDAGEVDALRGDDGEVRYRRCDSPRHHHHLVCRDCGRTVEVEAPAVEAWAAELAAAHGFADIDHTLEVVGTCRDCGE